MLYYTVHLPLGLNKELIYCSDAIIAEGARVIVSLGSKLNLGLCGTLTSVDPQSPIKYKYIEEVLDTASILPPELIKLGMWMAEYYHCPVGKALFAMLPSLLQPELDTKIKWIATETPPEFSRLHTILSTNENATVMELKKLLPGYPIYRNIEIAEARSLIEVQRKITHKDKPKTANYIIRLSSELDPDTLPLKQREAWEAILKEEPAFPLARISEQVSYSAVKSLVKKGFIMIEPRRVDPQSKLFEHVDMVEPVVLNPAQLQAISEIAMGYDSFDVNLLYGITGSGKTEVYIEVIRRYLAKNKSVIFLIPEIALTPQMVERFQGSFGNTLAIQHSQLSEKERLQQWQTISRGEKRIIIGARSAVFAPVPALGLIIVDEEHEGTYKQDNVPRYNGRDLAIVRAQLHAAQVILGSATPALESWRNAITGKYRLQRLESRPLDYNLPTVKVIDLRDEYDHELISPFLVEAIDQRLQKSEQVILFQNRRGYSSYLQCLKCGKLINCNNCEISMSYHRDREEMQCHYCGSSFPSPRKCPSCGSYSFSYGAPGTQKVEQTLRLVFPTAKILRVDSDSSRQRDTYKSMYNRMKKREVDILLGTQMISKGLDFPFVTLVGIVMADISLNIPDFRAAERTFQLITQVAGRSGRSVHPGEVIIQTYNPEHYAISAASRQDYLGFATEELEYRQKLYYPPYYRLARILWQSRDLAVINAESASLDVLKQTLGTQYPLPDLLLIGPSPAPFAKIANLYRHHLIIKARTSQVMKQVLSSFTALYTPPSGISQQIDVDPMHLM